MHEDDVRLPPVLLTDPSTGAGYHVDFSGALEWAAPDRTPPPAERDSALVEALTTVLSQKLAAHHVALPTLATSLPHFMPEVIAVANLRLAATGAQLHRAQLTAAVPQAAVQPAAAAIAAAPTVGEGVKSALVAGAEDRVARAIPRRVNVKVGGYRVGLTSDGVDGVGLADQVMNKAKDHLVGCLIIGGALGLVGLVCVVIVVKIALAL